VSAFASSIHETSICRVGFIADPADSDCASPRSASSESNHPVGALPAELTVGWARRWHGEPTKSTTDSQARRSPSRASQ
jgi:hypothetical protein